MEITLAKKTSTIRVFELARELSVTSKDLIAKCEAEGIPKITNHMSTISLGLAATVREWFGGGGTSKTTAVGDGTRRSHLPVGFFGSASRPAARSRMNPGIAIASARPTR